MSDNLTLGSLFSGSGGFELGGLLCGITPVWASEIEPFPIRVTTKRLPEMKHYGDICKLNGAEIEPVDIITFGSPCTDMSVAGKREGLSGSQSVLFYEAIRIIKEMRCATNGTKPRYIVWENVPGAFSSGKGQDFREVLSEIIKIKDTSAAIPMPENAKWLYAGEIMGDDYSVAWRTLDAQFFGVPQRRRRIYLVADFAGECAGKILFEREGVPRDFAQGASSGQGTAGSAKSGAPSAIGFEPGAASRLGGHVWDNLVGALKAHAGDNQTAVAIPIENHPADSRVKLQEHGIVQTLDARMGMGGGNVPLVMNERQFALTVSENLANTLTGTDFKGTQCVFTPKTLKIRSGCEGGGKGALVQEDKSATLSCNNDQTVFVPEVFGICADGSNSMKSDNPNSGIYRAQTTRTLDENGGNPSCNQGGMAIVSIQGSMIGRKDENGPQGSGINEDVSFTLNATDKHAVAYSLDRASYNQGQNAQFGISICEEQAQTLVAKGPHAVAHKDVQGLNTPEYAVRRLTPTECALLQGFPKNWCENLETSDPTEEEIAWWAEVFETHRKIIGKSAKPKSRNQIVKWLNSPYSDSAEYKMWGNGVALPCVVFVLSGISQNANL